MTIKVRYIKGMTSRSHRLNTLWGPSDVNTADDDDSWHYVEGEQLAFFEDEDDENPKFEIIEDGIVNGVI